MTLFQIAISVGPTLAALLILHHLASVKIDNDAILDAYRELRIEANRKQIAKAMADNAASES